MLAKIHPLIFILCASLTSFGQSPFLNKAIQYFEEHQEEWGLPNLKPHQLRLKNTVRDAHNGAEHFYFIQTHLGYEIVNTQFAVHFSKEGEVVFSNQNLINIDPKIEELVFQIERQSVILSKVGQHLDIPINKDQLRFQQQSKNVWTIPGGDIASQPIFLSKVLLPNEKGVFTPTWQVAIEPIGGSDFWNLYLDAETGNIIQQNSWTVHCKPSALREQISSASSNINKRSPIHSHKAHHAKPSFPSNQNQSSISNIGKGQANYSLIEPRYLVYPLPIENPLLGERALVNMPMNEASPFGWHDTDGQAGPEYIETRGNNVHAFLDRDANDQPDSLVVSGGTDFHFEFPFDLGMEPHDIQEAAVTQLFYTNNFLHDFSYRYGFDEMAGNFQENNYGKGGLGDDPIMANAQDGSGYNNANFSAPPDGMRGRMQMYLWGNRTSKMLTIHSPQEILGSFTARMASFGKEVRLEPVSGSIVLVRDTSDQPTLGCTQYQDPNQVRGKIAMIDRGVCEFGEKAYKAQLRGAIGVIIVNYEDQLLSMAPGVIGSNVDIPVIMITHSDGEKIKNHLQSGVEASIQLTGDEDILLDSDFDNGIIVHEYAHGISIRLTGGAANSNCLTNDEQMGEGWSDFFALALTSPFEDGAFPRSVGAFLTREPAFGRGIRRQKYSTDLNINSQTFYDIPGTESPHQLGEIWTSILWDLYWAFSEKYGYDPDLTYGNGGNNRAIQLIIDGMKLQNCNPGLLDARDAIIAADILNHNGANECLIWEIFARRGLGWNAQQKNTYNRHDGVASFESKPDCITTLKIEKNIDLEASFGQTVMANISIVNHQGFDAEQLKIVENIPKGSTYIVGSGRGVEKINLVHDQLIFEVPKLANGEKLNLKYELTATPDVPSRILFKDDVEGFFPLWESISLSGKEAWYKSSTTPNSGKKTWRMVNLPRANDQTLQLKEPVKIEGTHPIMRFFHQHATEPFYDGGRIEISLDQIQWEVLDQEIIKGGYTAQVDPNLFGDGFSFGYQGEKRTYDEVRIDLSAYQNQSVYIRFRFGSDDSQTVAPDSTFGWIIDDIEILDASLLQSTACIEQSGEDPICANFPFGGTLIFPGATTTVQEISAIEPAWEVFPNPTSNQITIQLDLLEQEKWQVDILSADGISFKRVNGKGALKEDLDLSDYPAGVYLARLVTPKGSFVKKLLVH